MKNSFRLGLSSSERAGVVGMVIAPRVHDELCSRFANAPGEMCGALFGDLSGSALCISGMKVCTNVAVSGFEFAIGLDELISACDSHGRRLIGIFHSHPESEPVPSCLDLPFLALSTFVWGIVGKAAPAGPFTTRCFVWSGGRLKEIVASPECGRFF